MSYPLPYPGYGPIGDFHTFHKLRIRSQILDELVTLLCGERVAFALGVNHPGFVLKTLLRLTVSMTNHKFSIHYDSRTLKL